MSRVFYAIAVTLLFVAGQTRAADDWDLELSLSSAQTSNLLNDSSETGDFYTPIGVTLSIYPVQRIKFDAKGEYTYYNKIENIRNFMYGATILAIPVSDTAGLSVYVSADFESRDYKSDSLNFNTTNTFTGIASAGYQLGTGRYLRWGYRYEMIDYTGSDVGEKHTHEAFAGFNTTVFGSASLDIETGITTGKYQYVDPVAYVGSLPYLEIAFADVYAPHVITKGTLKSYYFSPRFSFNIGERTGLALTFSLRSFLSPDDNAAIYGFTVPTLSPWGSDHEGTSVTAKLKSFVIPKIILNAGLGYFDKSFLNTLELIPNPDPNSEAYFLSIPKSILVRDDEQARAYVSIQYPMASRTGPFIEPSLQVEYTNNNSTIPVYDYDIVTISGALTIKILICSNFYVYGRILRESGHNCISWTRKIHFPQRK